ncbi:tetratricopeptide repeat protein [Raineya orbicola]|jgi:serine phosphatase RsbU (regulator of sigma subunit)/tetratricopeptide (TPR) repeat protein|uniref:Stage II sporulation protein E (SpoIIE) n=1 Tax=Raineya orbicola TaxID=2016530 RepID=A0A2N3IH54_9BACT|nr:tetratricopeptide repeat protein [Raineya orbicola]PKQ69645.1 Stage II sporulation protein E (SpoIIE) [Raineya orbicola]
MRWFVLGIVWIFALPLFSQKKALIDSLQKELEKHPKPDSIRLQILIELGWQYRNSNINKAFEYNRDAVYLANELKNEAILARIFNHRGVLYRNISDFPEAEKKFYEALHIAEKYQNLQEIAYANNNLGDLLRLTGNTAESIKFMQKAQEIFKKLKDKRGEAYTYIRLSEAFQKLGDLEKAEEMAQKCLVLRQDLGNQQDLGAALNRVGDVLAIREKYNEALEYYRKALNIAINQNDATAKVSSLQDIGKVFIRTQRYKEAEKPLMEALEIAKNFQSKEQESNIYEFLSELYEKQNNIDKAYFYYKKRQALRDTIFSNQRMLQIDQMRVRFDLQQKESENQILKEKLQKEQIIRILGLVFSFVVLLGGIWIFLNNRKINKINYQLAEKNNEIKNTLKELEEANRQIVAQNKEIEVRNQEIELKNQDFIQSIGYALVIQEAMLPSKAMLDRLLGEYFVIWEPKDIVSGDFYWIAEKEDLLIIAVGDCTGHGVPGALMSSLGVNALNVVVHERGIIQPAEILEQMHQETLIRLHKEVNQLIDGMELGVLVIHRGKNMMYYAGAGIPLYYVQEYQLHVLEANKSSVGSNFRGSEPFSEHKIYLEYPTYFYMASDGFKDQFGGKQNKKFGSKQFKSLLKEFSFLPVEQQKDLLSKNLYLWKKEANEAQTDDITLIGFRYNPIKHFSGASSYENHYQTN